MLRLVDVWKSLCGVVPDAVARLDQAITNVVVDSRQVGPGALFVALAGERTDGHLYVEQALERGAVAVIAGPKVLGRELRATIVQTAANFDRQLDPPYIFVVPDSLKALQDLAMWWRVRMPVTAIGITGSVGKTTTKETVANVLSRTFVTLRSEGNLNNEIGLPLTLLHLNESHQRAVLEMGTYGIGEIARLCEIARPRIGVVTNIGPTHLERLGTMDRIVHAKTELVASLPPADQGGVAILNADDPAVIGMASSTRARVLRYGLTPESDLWADQIVSEGLEGIGFRMHYLAQKPFHVRLPLLGRHSVHTALRGAAVGLSENMSWTDILAGLQEGQHQLRLMVVPGLRGARIIDDTYNASPSSMLAALNLLSDITVDEGRKIAVLGDMLELGSYEEEGHRLVGGRAARVAQQLITVGKRSGWIADEAVDAGMAPANVRSVETNADAIDILTGIIRAGDVILVKGSRGLAMEQIVDAISQPDVAS